MDPTPSSAFRESGMEEPSGYHWELRKPVTFPVDFQKLLTTKSLRKDRDLAPGP